MLHNLKCSGLCEVTDNLTYLSTQTKELMSVVGRMYLRNVISMFQTFPLFIDLFLLVSLKLLVKLHVT